MNPRGRLTRSVIATVATTLVVLGLAIEARAHFLFIRIGAPAEAGRSAEVFFSEQAEAGDPKFVAKIAHTMLWIQTRPGEFRELPINRPPTGYGPLYRLIAAWPSSANANTACWHVPRKLHSCSAIIPRRSPATPTS